MRLRFGDDLVLGIGGGHSGVALYHAFACRHPFDRLRTSFAD